jgi:hypothetical protein
MAARWMKDYEEKTKPKKRNIHAFMVFLRKKIIPSIAREELWKKYEGCHQGQFGHDSPVNIFSQALQDYQIRCRDNKGKALISDHALKMKFVNGLTPLIKQQVKLAINWNMSFEEIVTKLEQIQATMKQGYRTNQPQQQKRHSPPCKEWRSGKPME